MNTTNNITINPLYTTGTGPIDLELYFKKNGFVFYSGLLKIKCVEFKFGNNKIDHRFVALIPLNSIIYIAYQTKKKGYVQTTTGRFNFSGTVKTDALCVDYNNCCNLDSLKILFNEDNQQFSSNQYYNEQQPNNN